MLKIPLGRDYDAAVTVGGFLGFGLSSMPVAMATMHRVASRYGPSPKAFLLITLNPDKAIEPQRTPVPTASALVRKESPGISGSSDVSAWGMLRKILNSRAPRGLEV